MMRRALLSGLVSGLVCASAFFSSAPVPAHEGVNAEIAALDRRIHDHPSDPSLLIARAVLYRREGHYVNALADLDRAEALSPGRRDVSLERGLVLAAKGDAAQAEVVLGRFLASGPPRAVAFEARGKIREAKKRFAEAWADYNAAVKLRPDPENYLARGRVDEAMGKLERAAKGYEEGLRALSGAVVLRLAWIRVEGKLGRYDRAIRLVDEVLAKVPRKAEWLLMRADLRASAGHSDEARKDREAALSELDAVLGRRPTELARVTHARALHSLGRKAEALSELEAVVSRSPHFLEAKKILAEIKKPAPAP